MIKLNYLQIRILVRSNKLILDLNNNLFNHPKFNNHQIEEIDNYIKDISFNNHFNKLSDTSYNPYFDDILTNNFGIKVNLVLKPDNDYKPFRQLKGFNYKLTKFINFLNHRNSIKLLPNRIYTLPLSIKAINNDNIIPNIHFELDEKLYKLGLRYIDIKLANNDNEDTYIVLTNTNSYSIYLDDLIHLGEMFVLK